MYGKTLIHFQRNKKDICILLKEGEVISLENIVDVFVSDITESNKIKDSNNRVFVTQNPDRAILR